MTILNPDKHVRIGYIAALQAATGLKVWHRRIPKNVTVPAKYIILDTQSKNETVNAKNNEERETYFEWLVTLDVNIYNVNQLGYSNAEAVDDIEQIIISVIRQGINIPNFNNKNTQIIESQDLSADTTTQSIDRKLIKFEHWLNRSEII